MAARSERRVDSRLWWLAGCLTFLFVALGCNPGALSMLLLPFDDGKLPPRCKISKKGEETTVVIHTTFAKGDVPLELEPAARELTDALSIQLRKRLTANKEKVIIVSPSKVRSFVNNRLGERLDELDIGDHFKADIIITLEIVSFALHEPKSRMLFRGHTEINVVATDLHELEGENRILSDVYRTSYPSSGPQDAGGGSATQFRAAFLNKVSRDISRWFAAYPKDERFDMD